MRVTCVFVCLAIAACERAPTETATSFDANVTALRRANDRTVETVLRYTDQDFSEGLTLSNRGDLYVGFGFSGDIVKVSRTGDAALFSSIDPTDNSITLGLAASPKGDIYAAVWGFDESTNGVWKVDPHGHASRFASMPLGTIPNAIVIGENGDLLITDSSEPGQVWRAKSTGGDASLWIQTDLLAPAPGGFGANGMARFGDQVYVLNYDRGRIVRIPIRSDGSAGRPSLVVEDPQLVNADGITLDVQGNMYIGRTVPSSLLQVSPEGVIQTLVDFPADLPTATNVVFGRGAERATLYLTIGDVGGAANVVKVRIPR